MEQSTDLIYGRHAILEILRRDPCVFEHIWILESAFRSESIRSSIQDARKKGVSVTVVSRNALDRICNGAKHQGMAARRSIKQLMDMEDWLESLPAGSRYSVVLVLDRIQDPQNLGAIFRSAAALPVSGIIVPKTHRAPFSAAALKASAGTMESVPAVRAGNLRDAINRLKEAGYWVIGLSQEAGTSIAGYVFPAKTALVIGGEESGIRRLQREACDEILSIPLRGPAGSLNVSVAAGIALYAFVCSISPENSGHAST